MTEETMGKTKIATIDDSVQEEVKGKPSHSSSSKKKLDKAAKSEPVKVYGEVERTTESETSSPEQGAKQTLSEPTGEASGTLRLDEPPSPKKVQKPGKAKPRSKTYPLPDAVDMVKKLNYAKFNATIGVSINTVQTGIRGLVSLPYASGKKIRILAFGKGADQSGADIIGTDSTLEEIEKGKINFDLVITTPEWMPKLAKVAKVLGPKGLMPNPKNGTITEDLKKAVEGFQGGKTEYKTEAKAPVIHLGLGKLDQPTEELSANVKTLLQTVGKTKIKKVSLSPTMGPSIKVDLASF